MKQSVILIVEGKVFIVANKIHTPEIYYDEVYFAKQREAGKFGAKLEMAKFTNFVSKNSCIIDFGCGGGYLLASFDVEQKIGVEINEIARSECTKLGIQAVPTIDDLPDEFGDLVISNHALEHVRCPFDVLVRLQRKLQTRATVVFVVPHQTVNQKWAADDFNMHLYTWNPLTLGNLFEAAGYRVVDVEVIRHFWLPDRLGLRQIVTFGTAGRWVFDRMCTINAVLHGRYQLRITAEYLRS